MSPQITAAHVRDWEELSQLDPLFAILTEKEKQFGKWDPKEFFASGQAEIDALMKSCGIPAGDHGRALDFGCGVGRLSNALRLYFGDVWGVDVSSGMVELARRYVTSCSFVVNQSDNLSQFGNDSFDFIYSNIVLQHQPSKEIARSYIREFVRLLKPEGMAVFQMPYKLSLRHALQPKRRLYSYLRKLGLPTDFVYRRLHLNPIRTISLSQAKSRKQCRNVAGGLCGAIPTSSIITA